MPSFVFWTRMIIVWMPSVLWGTGMMDFLGPVSFLGRGKCFVDAQAPCFLYERGARVCQSMNAMYFRQTPEVFGERGNMRRTNQYVWIF